MTLNSLGEVAILRHDYDTARTHLQESLLLSQSLGAKAQICKSLEMLALLASAQQQDERAARLYGASDALSQTIGAWLEPSAVAEHDHILAQLCATLGDDHFETAWTGGRAFSWDEAVAYALSDPQTDIQQGTIPCPNPS